MLGLTVNSTPGTVDSAVKVAAEHDKVRVSGVGVLPKCVGGQRGGWGASGSGSRGGHICLEQKRIDKIDFTPAEDYLHVRPSFFTGYVTCLGCGYPLRTVSPRQTVDSSF